VASLDDYIWTWFGDRMVGQRSGRFHGTFIVAGEHYYLSIFLLFNSPKKPNITISIEDRLKLAAAAIDRTDLRQLNGDFLQPFSFTES